MLLISRYNIRRSFENRRKGYFYLTLDSPVDGKVLEIGAGSGIISDVLATYFQNVTAVEFDETWVEFMRLRFQQDLRTNISLVRAKNWELPFRPETFDLVIINGLPEMVGEEGSVCASHLQFLKDCAALLTPTGKLAISIRNQLYPKQLFRPEADAAYSYWGIRRLLRLSGFTRLSMHIALPTYHDPILIAPTAPNAVLHDALLSANSLPNCRGRRAAYIILSRIGMLRYLLHSFVISGEKHG